MNQAQLEKKVKYWQKILKLDHWKITAHLVNHDILNNRVGDVTMESEYMSAQIRIQDPKHFDDHIEDSDYEVMKKQEAALLAQLNK